MTVNLILTVLSVSIFLTLLGIATFHVVLTLKQARQTARVLEDYLNATRPKVEEAVDRLGSVLQRTDNVLAVAEKGAGRFGSDAESAARRFNSFLSTMATAFATAGTISQIIKLFTGRRTASAPKATKGGRA